MQVIFIAYGVLHQNINEPMDPVMSWRDFTMREDR